MVRIEQDPPTRRMHSLGTGSEIFEDPDESCCHRATICNPYIRDISVMDPVCGCCCEQLTHATLFWLVTVTAMVFMSYAILYLFLGELMLPGGNMFGLFAVIVFAYFLGWSLAYLPLLNLPPVFGMLLAGIMARNFDWYNIHEALGSTVIRKIRTFSVTFVLLRAGLELTHTPLREHPFFVINLAVIPCSLEMITVALGSYLLLQYPWDWAFLTGSILACISPVVPVNCILALADRGYGEDTDIATLLFTAASIDDIHIVSLYSLFFSITFTIDNHAESHWWLYIPPGLRDLIAGVCFGFVLGFFFIFFPHRKDPYVFWYRVVGLVLGSLMCTTGAARFAITGGAFLATIIMSLIATTGWRILTNPFDIKPLRKSVHIMWHFMQPVLAGVIGAEIDLHNWSNPRLILHLIVITFGTTVRLIFAFLATFHTDFSSKERLFIALSWISKGTLQAALAPMTLEQAEKDDDPGEMEKAIDVVRLSVVSVMILAPLGAMIMMMTGPLLLNKTSYEEHQRRRELSYLRLLSLQPVRRRRSQRIDNRRSRIV
ncbi:hypothetical protein QAD02_016257 [Eretmocerus hayati]|uniref:Uncharacterized protein n=1 Tax=Eretmocerus hayati TaxID=131215 RepID=A0ACC2PA39_9HYME|nr:hypothetical protein QAD02_016257 [Eretmocerus hayati]